jgi:hypothetical protein
VFLGSSEEFNRLHYGNYPGRAQAEELHFMLIGFCRQSTLALYGLPISPQYPNSFYGHAIRTQLIKLAMMRAEAVTIMALS